MSAARNHGAAGTGTSEFISERFTALALIVLGLILGAKLVGLSAGGVDLIEARTWLGDALNAGLMLTFFALGMLHSFICSKVLLEDYIHIPGLKILLIIALAAGTTSAFVVAAISILRSLFLGLG